MTDKELLEKAAAALYNLARLFALTVADTEDPDWYHEYEAAKAVVQEIDNRLENYGVESV